MYKSFFSIIFIFSLFSSLTAQNRLIIQSDGLFFTDSTQTTLYSGEYKEFYENKSLKLEMNILNGKPEGAYIVYFANGKPNEYRFVSSKNIVKELNL